MEKTNFEVVNITAKGNLMSEINLNKLAINLPHSEYEPERFPGLIYRLIKPSATFILYKSGKFILMGVKNKEEIERAIYHIEDLFKDDNQQKKEKIEKDP